MVQRGYIHHGTLEKDRGCLAGHLASVFSLVTCNKTGGTSLPWETSIGVRDYDLSYRLTTRIKAQDR